jgi:hypothetical protein
MGSIDKNDIHSHLIFFLKKPVPAATEPRPEKGASGTRTL